MAARVVAAALTLGVLAGVGGFLYWQQAAEKRAAAPPAREAPAADTSRSTVKPRFRCDGRTRCEQMTSCEEAMFFLQNCPRMELDQDKDGIPCEVQWCQR